LNWRLKEKVQTGLYIEVKKVENPFSIAFNGKQGSEEKFVDM